MNSSKQTLDIAIYSLTHPDIVSAIKEANKRGVAIRIISDKIQSAGKTLLHMSLKHQKNALILPVMELKARLINWRN
nr:phospholipase D-like domain-containing protein [Paenibacillus sp. GP183]